jgi:hypothetical protein
LGLSKSSESKKESWITRFASAGWSSAFLFHAKTQRAKNAKEFYLGKGFRIYSLRSYSWWLLLGIFVSRGDAEARRRKGVFIWTGLVNGRKQQNILVDFSLIGFGIE